MTRPRVAVVGAGPAGSTAARLLAARGAEVVLFEARPLPRAKLCGGGLTPKAQRLVPNAALRAVERHVDRVELRGPHLPPIHIADPAASIAMVERSRFDLVLVEAAAEAGVEVRDGDPVRGLLEHEAGVDVRTGRDQWRADAVVIADGEPSGTARKVGLGGPARRRALALAVDLPFAVGLERDTAVLSYRFPGGYGWYFPKGDHANVGVGSHRPSRYDRLREDIADFASELGLDLTHGRVRGHWIPQGLRRGPLAVGTDRAARRRCATVRTDYATRCRPPRLMRGLRHSCEFERDSPTRSVSASGTYISTPLDIQVVAP